jgi:hypothetical protein
MRFSAWKDLPHWRSERKIQIWRGVYMSAGEGMQLFLEVDGMLTQVFTVKQTSYHVKYSVRTLHQWIDEGKLIAYKVANMLLIPESEINRIRWRDNPPPHLPIYR